MNVCLIRKQEIVGHVPIELSQLLSFAIDSGCLIRGAVVDTEPMISPLTQGGLEIKCVVDCRWPNDEADASKKKLALLEKLLAEKYTFENRLTDETAEIMKEIEARMNAVDQDDYDHDVNFLEDEGQGEDNFIHVHDDIEE